MYTNTSYNMSISQEIWVIIVLFAKLNVCQFAFTFEFTKYNVHQIYCIYSFCTLTSVTSGCLTGKCTNDNSLLHFTRVVHCSCATSDL